MRSRMKAKVASMIVGNQQTVGISRGMDKVMNEFSIAKTMKLRGKSDY